MFNYKNVLNQYIQNILKFSEFLTNVKIFNIAHKTSKVNLFAHKKIVPINI